MNKKLLVGILAGAMSAALSLTAMADLRLVNGKIEVDAQLKELAAAYEDHHTASAAYYRISSGAWLYLYL